MVPQAVALRRASHGLALALLGPLAASETATLGTVSWGVERLAGVSSVGPEAVLPAFKFQAWAGPAVGKAPQAPAWQDVDLGMPATPGVQASGYEARLPHPASGAPPPHLPNPAAVAPQDNCPDAVFRNSVMQTGGALPYQPIFEIGCEAFSAANDTEVRVAVLENEALRVAVMPTGGKIWSIYDKKRRRQLLYNPPALQLGQNAYRPWGPGGMEWNWSPGVVGHIPPLHSSPVFVAKVATPKGEVLRVGEFDRWNNTAWQVDMLLDGDRCAGIFICFGAARCQKMFVRTGCSSTRRSPTPTPTPSRATGGRRPPSAPRRRHGSWLRSPWR